MAQTISAICYGLFAIMYLTIDARRMEQGYSDRRRLSVCLSVYVFTHNKSHRTEVTSSKYTHDGLKAPWRS